MKINAIDIKPGIVLENKGKLWLVLKREIVQPGKGGAFAQVEMRDIKTGTKTNRALPHAGNRRARPARRKGDAVPLFATAIRRLSWTARPSSSCTVDRELIGEPADFLQEGMICTIQTL